MSVSSARPQVVALCGSTKFKAEFMDVAARMTLSGIIVLGPNVFAHADDVPLTDEEKEALDALHLQKIDRAGSIYVLNVDGYIGESTKREIAYAYSMGKGITYHHPVLTTTVELSYTVKDDRPPQEWEVQHIARNIIAKNSKSESFDFVPNQDSEVEFKFPYVLNDWNSVEDAVYDEDKP